MRPRIIIRGDEELSSEYVETALLELYKLKELMKFQGLKQDVRKTILNDGTIIRCQSVFGDDTITIDTLPVAEAEKKEEEEILEVTFCLLIQTGLSITINSETLNDASYIISGVVKGLLDNDPIIYDNPANAGLIIQLNYGSFGTLYVNDIEITDDIWAVGTWLEATGWPKTWRIECDVPYVPTMNVTPGINEDVYFYEPVGVNLSQYVTGEYRDTSHQWYAEYLLGPHTCDNDILYDGIAFSLNFDDCGWDTIYFRLRFVADTDWFSNNFTIGDRYVPADIIRYQAEHSIYGGAGPAPFAGPIELYPYQIRDYIYNSGALMFISRYKYIFDNPVWTYTSGVCDEDLPAADPSFVPLTYSYTPVGEARRFSEVELTFDSNDSPLEELFAERGYPHVTQTITPTYSGVAEEIL